MISEDLGKRIGGGASACSQIGNGEHSMSHSQGTQGFLARRKMTVATGATRAGFLQHIQTGERGGCRRNA